MTFQAARRSYTFDAGMQFKDAGLVAASAAAQVSSADKIVSVGNDAIKAVMVIDVSAVEIDTANELYTVTIQGSTSATFASDKQNLATMHFGSTAVRPGGAIDTLVGRYELPFINVQNGVVYPYLRIYTTVAGTIATGINYTAFAGLDC